MSDAIPANHLASIVASSADAIVSEDLDGFVLSWNPAAERLFGYAEADITGRSIDLLIPDERSHEGRDERDRVRLGKSVSQFETERRHRKGYLINVAVSVSPLLGAHGEVLGAVKVIRDISDRVLAERELRQANQRLRALIEASKVLTEATEVSDVWRRSVGLAEEALTADGYAAWSVEPDGHSVVIAARGVSEAFARDTVAGADPTQVAAFLQSPSYIEDVAAMPSLGARQERYRAEGIRSIAVFPVRLKGVPQGTLVLYYRRPRTLSALERQTGEALSNLASAALAAVETYQTQRRAAQRAAFLAQQAEFLSEATAVLHHSLNYQETLTSLTSLAVPTIADWCAADMLDGSGNPVRLSVAHIDPEKVELAHRLHARYPPDPDAPGGLHAVIRTGKPAMMSRIPAELLERAARDAEHLDLVRSLSLTSYICVPLTTRLGVVGAISFVSAESGREYTAEDLEFAVEVARRASLAIENSLAYDEATRANRLKDDFLATLSHEIRTPLNAVLGYVRMLRTGTVAVERESRALEVIERNADALHRMISDVLDVERIVAGRLHLHIQEVRVGPLVQEAIAAIAPAAEAKGVALLFSESAVDTTVLADASRLHQVVWNLLQNAVKFTPSGGRVHVTHARVGTSVALSVSDTGVGISGEFLPHVFERFRQGAGVRASAGGGLGLGLAIAKELVELHGGHIGVESAGQHRGATFTVTLPAAPAAGEVGSPV